LGYYNGKSLWVPHGQVSKHFPVEVNVSFLHGSDEPAVADSIQPCGCIDTGDPQSAEIAFANTAIAGGVPHALEHGFVGSFKEKMSRSSLAFCKL
jgi:hypothetical protein